MKDSSVRLTRGRNVHEQADEKGIGWTRARAMGGGAHKETGIEKRRICITEECGG